MGVRNISIDWYRGTRYLIAEVSCESNSQDLRTALEDVYAREHPAVLVRGVLWILVTREGLVCKHWKVYYCGNAQECIAAAKPGDYIVLSTTQYTVSDVLRIVQNFAAPPATMPAPVTPTVPAEPAKPDEPKLDGSLKVMYYKLKIEHPLTLEEPYTVECGDVIAALGLTYAEGNILKALWRIGQHRAGRGKPGGSVKYDRDKIVAMAAMLEKEAKYARTGMEDDKCVE